MRRATRITLHGLGLLAFVVAGVWWWQRPRTPPVRSEDGREIEGAVASLERIELGGSPQWILVRGDPAKPLVVFLHGGPGMPTMWMAHRFQRPLEDEFLLVHWDQRGAGKSFAERPPPETMTDERILADALELIDTLSRRYRKDRVVLVGHSWGTYVGTLFARRHPERLHAYVGIGQVTGSAERDSIVEAWIAARARESGETEAIADVEERGTAAQEEWLFRFGGEIHGETSFMPFVWTGLKAPEYGLMDVPRVPRGSSWSSEHMREIALDGPLHEEIRCLAVPVRLFVGRHDYVTPAELAVDWLERLEAPSKGVVRFEDSAHFPHYEEPDRFADALREVWASVEERTAAPGFCEAADGSSGEPRSAEATARLDDAGPSR